MAKTQDKKRKQELGIFYTPSEVVHFIFEILNLWKESQPNRWKTKEGKPKYPSVIDPAVGEGVFLKVAIEKNFTKPDWIFGLDIDENAVKKWKEINLLKEFGGIDKDLEAHFFHQNGLEKIKWGQHKDKYKYKLKQVDINNQQFDTVVGNPPYGGVGLGETEITDDLITQLAKFEILPKITKDSLSVANTQTDLFGSDKSFSLKSDAKQRIKSFPIEILFLERFIQLAKPGGWIAIVIPDGILTNSNADYVREYISKKTTVNAIISLPRNTFKNAGTSAKTSILFLRKLKDNEKPEKNYPVFLASIENINSNNFQKIIEAYQKLYNNKEKNMDKSQLVQITNDQTGKEVIMIRVDKTLKNMLDEKPFSRFDINYWHPKWDNIINDFRSRGVKKRYLGECIDNDNWLISTDHVRASKGEKEAPNLPVEYYSPAGFLFTGYDISQIPRCSENAFKRMQRAKPIKDDVLLGGFGMGPTGKSLVLWHTPSAKAIVGNIFILRVKDFYDPYVLDVFFKTNYGQAQFNKYKTGVAFNSLSNDEIKYLLVPEFNDRIIKSIHSEYVKITKMHDRAMEAKRKDDKHEYKTNLEIAEGMLEDLIIKTEEVIRGERDDVN